MRQLLGRAGWEDVVMLFMCHIAWVVVRCKGYDVMIGGCKAKSHTASYLGGSSSFKRSGFSDMPADLGRHIQYRVIPAAPCLELEDPCCGGQSYQLQQPSNRTENVKSWLPSLVPTSRAATIGLADSFVT